MRNENVNINILYSDLDFNNDHKYLNWSENLSVLLESFLSTYPQLKITSKIINVDRATDLDKLNLKKSITVIILTEDMLSYEKQFLNLDTHLCPIIINERDINHYIEKYSGCLVYFLTNVNRKLFDSNYAKLLMKSRGNEPILNFICYISENWLKELGLIKVKYSKNEKILLGTVSPSLFDYRLQIKMYLENEGYRVSLFSTNITDKEKRKQLYKGSCKEHDAVIHFLNENLKRHTNDESSIFIDEINQLVDYLKELGNKVFHGFCWIAPLIDIDQSSELKNTVEFVKKTSAQSHLFHSYQVSIGEFKKLLLSRLMFFFNAKQETKNEKSNSIFIYDYKDMEKAGYLCRDLSNEYSDLITYQDLNKKGDLYLNKKTMSLFKNIIIYVEKVEHEWVESMIRYLMKVTGGSEDVKIRIICGGKYHILDELKKYNFKIEYLK